MKVKEIQNEIYQWYEEQSWHNKLPLEYLALISSEIGEAVNECRDKTPTNRLGEELADIVLRVFDFAKVQNIDMEKELRKKMDKNLKKGRKVERIK
jgi:NTP pyrophosphatase (non-canonical NTP hydrolase)